VGARSEIGTYRQNNEDRLLADGVLGLFLVADGMGGQLAGEKASELAVDIVSERIERDLAGCGDAPDDISAVIKRAAVEANREIMALAAMQLEYQSMGTTLVMALFRGKNAFVAGIGDSRVYHLHRSKLTQITEDHSLAQALYQHGTISASELKTHRFRNILWKYLGSKEATGGPDIQVIAAQPGDRFVMSSDGLTGVVPDDAIQRTVAAENDPQKAVESLIQQALDNDSHDNITCVAVYVD
jgi:protein phosphatase